MSLITNASHLTNPIESYFSQLKHYMKLDSKVSFDELKRSVRTSMRKITKTNCKNYFFNSLDKGKLKNRERTVHIVKKNYRR